MYNDAGPVIIEAFFDTHANRPPPLAEKAMEKQNEDLNLDNKELRDQLALVRFGF